VSPQQKEVSSMWHKAQFNSQDVFFIYGHVRQRVSPRDTIDPDLFGKIISDTVTLKRQKRSLELANEIARVKPLVAAQDAAAVVAASTREAERFVAQDNESSDDNVLDDEDEVAAAAAGEEDDEEEELVEMTPEEIALEDAEIALRKHNKREHFASWDLLCLFRTAQLLENPRSRNTNSKLELHLADAFTGLALLTEDPDTDFVEDPEDKMPRKEVEFYQRKPHTKLHLVWQAAIDYSSNSSKIRDGRLSFDELSATLERMTRTGHIDAACMARSQSWRVFPPKATCIMPDDMAAMYYDELQIDRETARISLPEFIKLSKALTLTRKLSIWYLENPYRGFFEKNRARATEVVLQQLQAYGYQLHNARANNPELAEPDVDSLPLVL
jgi:hypothetical protein